MNSKKSSGASKRQIDKPGTVALRDMPNPTVVCDASLRVLQVSRSFERITGYKSESWTQSPLVYQLLPPEEQELVRIFLEGFLASKKDKITREIKWTDEKVHEHILHWTVHKVVSRDQTLLIGQAIDITQSKSAQDKLLKDSLTGLYKSKMFESTIERLQAQVVRTEQQEYAVLYIDLDHFKRFNHVHGTEMAEKLLIVVSQRLSESVRQSDLVARFGADKFGIIISELTHHNDAVRVAEKILLDIRVPFIIGELEVAITASIGLVIPTAEHTMDMIKAHADQAMHRAKEGHNRVVIYDEIMYRDALAELGLESKLRLAAAHPDDWFELHYMPIVSLESGLITKFEALIRMREQPGENQLIMPNDFISIAERTGLIVPIGDWVLERACSVLTQWHKVRTRTPVSMSINVSVIQFEQSDFIAKLKRIIKKTGVRPEFLRLEITETVTITRRKLIVDRMTELNKIRVASSIDDFGAGQTALEHLAQLPTSSIKFDMALVADVHTNPRKRTVLSHMVAMGSELKNIMISEGIETEDQARAMMQMNCHLAQGYWFQPGVDQFIAERMIDTQPFVPQVQALKIA